MWSLARGMAQYSLKNSREYPKTSGAIPLGLRPLGIAPLVFGYSLSFFREYFAIRLTKLHILLHDAGIFGKQMCPSHGISGVSVGFATLFHNDPAACAATGAKVENWGRGKELGTDGGRPFKLP